MRVAVFNGPGRPITLECVPVPEPGEGELLVKVGRCGVCGSDLAMTSGSPFDYAAGCRLGHEYAGEVVELGAATDGFRPGDRVACLPQAGCGACQACRGGRPIMCAQVRFVSGGFGDYVAVPAGNAQRLPQSLSLADGALVEPLACGLRALRLAGLRGGERVLALGAGSMAIAVVYWARRLGGGRIVAASRSGDGREALMALGADAVLALDPDDPQQLARALGGPADIVAECVGKPGLINRAIQEARPGGAVIALGMCMQPEPILPVLCAFKEIRLSFPLAYSVEEFAETARAFDAGLRPDLVVSEVIALDELPARLEAMRAGARAQKVQVDPSLEAAHAVR